MHLKLLQFYRNIQMLQVHFSKFILVIVKVNIDTNTPQYINRPITPATPETITSGI